MSDLRTDFKDDVLNVTTNDKRKYRMINNADGTVSFEDVTDYVQQGDTFGATEVNQITEKVNSCLTRQDAVDNLESTATDLPLSANMGRELNNNFKDFIKLAVSSETKSFTANTRVNITFTPPVVEGYKAVALLGVYNTDSNNLTMHFILNWSYTAQCSVNVTGEFALHGTFLMVRDL